MRTRRSEKQGRQRGMTLVEIMIVLAIIAMVMGMVGFAAFPMLQKANCKAAWSQTQTIQQAIATFQTDNAGDCPKTLDDLVSGKFITKAPVDPWNQPFKFKCPGEKAGADTADIWSSGKNKQDGDDDDIRGWVKLEEACKAK